MKPAVPVGGGWVVASPRACVSWGVAQGWNVDKISCFRRLLCGVGGWGTLLGPEGPAAPWWPRVALLLGVVLAVWCVAGSSGCGFVRLVV